MLDICFNDSVKGLLKYSSKDINIKTENILGLTFSLWQGDIKSQITSDNCPQKRIVKQAFLFDRHGTERDMESYGEKYWQNCISDLEKVKADDSEVRLWVDNTPETQCGLLFIADLLKDSHRPIIVLQLPQQIERDDGTVLKHKYWGEVSPKELKSLMGNQKVLSSKELITLSENWCKLKEENAPLRVVENGQVVSANIDYYDHLIRKEFPQDSCAVANIIGYTLGRNQLALNDIFIAQRIVHFIDTGELVVADQSRKGFYNTVVARVK